MTASLLRVPGPEAYDLIYHAHLAMLPISDREAMKQYMMKSSRAWIGEQDGKVLCFLGLVPPTLLSDRAYLWLYTTPHLREHVFTFVRYSQRVVAEMLEEFPLIVGHCEASAPKSIRWLKWLGAEFGPPQGPAIPFEIRAKQDG